MDREFALKHWRLGVERAELCSKSCRASLSCRRSRHVECHSRKDRPGNRSSPPPRDSFAARVFKALGVFAILPYSRTSFRRPASASATAIASLCTSRPTYMIGGVRQIRGADVLRTSRRQHGRRHPPGSDQPRLCWSLRLWQDPNRDDARRLRRSAEADQTSAPRSLAGADQRASRRIHRLADL